MTLTVALTNAAGTVTLAIPAALANLDSGQQVSQQSGYSAADTLIRSIFRAACFTDGAGTWYPTSAIQKIVVNP
jgi:hypothetical protein